MTMRRMHRFACAAPLLLALAPGCAEERAPINRVQADALAKEFFVGDLSTPDDDPQFYWRNFVVDGSEAQSMIGIGSWSAVDRIRWEITEKMLIARKSYPLSPGATPHGDGEGHPDGIVVAVYPIEKHFDIKRAYNATTGEEMNVVEENAADRPWNKREFMRVDWSMNLVDTPTWSDMFQGKLFGDITVSPIAYTVNDSEHPDRPHFEPEKGYFDITSKFLVSPAEMESPFIDLDGTVPACVVMGLYTGSAVNSCDPQEAVVRSSFLRVDRVDPDEDFEPFENTHSSLDVIGNPGGLGSSMSSGIVTPPRVDWDPQYGYTDAGMHKYMHHHNVWEQSHQTTGVCKSDDECGGGTCLPSGACTVPCDYEVQNQVNGTNVQCTNELTGYDGNAGSQCSARGRCTIPVRDREISPVAYWMSRDTPEALTDPLDENGNPTGRGDTEDLIYTWNQAMRFSVAKAREVECRNTGSGDRDTCHGLYFEPGQTEMVSFGGWGMDQVKPMDDVLVVCHNPVRSYDPEVCGEEGYSPRVGDLRHNFLYYWPHASRAPWGGIANWNADPLTGQIIGASATTMGRSATRAAAMIRDIVMVANGELTMADITGGTTAELYERRLHEGHAPRALREEEIQARLAAVDAAHVAEQVAPNIEAGDIADMSRAQIRMVADTQAVVGAASPSQLEYEAIVDKLRGTVYEAQLVDPSYLADTVGAAPGTAVTDDVLDAVSPLRGLDHGAVDAMLGLVDLRLQARGVCFLEHHMGDVGNHDIQGIARRFAEKYSDENLRGMLDGFEEATPEQLSQARADLIYEELWRETYKGIQLHEVGHSLGMLHQFASSYDSANYNPQYWQLRTQEGQASQSCAGQPRTGDTHSAQSDSCMGPRYLDPETDDEQGRAGESRPGINYYAHTSTMEYQNERFFETIGLGQYDLHTMNVLYGRVIQTFDEREIPIESPGGTHAVGDLGQNDFALRNWTQLSEQNLVNWLNPDISPIQAFPQPMHYTEQARQMRVFDPARCRDATEDEKEQAKWRIVHGKVCATPPKDYGRWSDFIDASATGDPGDFETFKVRVRPDAGSAPNAVRWPYRWGVSSNAYMHTNPSDAGADPYEVTRATIEKFEYSYPFTYFRRQNRDWYYRSIPARTASRFFERLRSFHWSIAINTARYEAAGFYDQVAESDDFWRPYVMAQTDMFDAITKALLSPQIGTYEPMGGVVGATRPIYDVNQGGPGDFLVDASAGRYIDPDFNGDPDGGGSWEYQSWVNWTGFSVEKGDAAKALTDGRAVLFTIARENYLDGRNVNINFRSDMPQAVDRLIGGLLSSDWETIAPYAEVGADGHAAIQSTDLTTAAVVRPEGSRLVFPNVGYKQQLHTLVWAHSFSRLNGDLALTNKLRLWVDGMVGEVNVPEDQQVRFYNPESGYTYIARSYGTEMIDGKKVDRGIASRMVEHANMLLMDAYEVEIDEEGYVVTDEFGTPIVVEDEYGQAVVRDGAGPNELAAYRGYVGLLDASVQLGNLVGYGPLSGVPDPSSD